jgi:hypothetical protein
MVIAAAALKEIARAIDVAKPTGMASGIKLLLSLKQPHPHVTGTGK